ncbi:hypothetical protein MRX96_004191 [Rhipicephalus microplus]
MNESRLADKWRPDHLGGLATGVRRSGAHEKLGPAGFRATPIAHVWFGHRASLMSPPRGLSSLARERSTKVARNLVISLPVILMVPDGPSRKQQLR